MLKRLLFSLLAIVLVSLPIFTSPPKATAVDWGDLIPGDDPTVETTQDFCKRRQGNQMNLETWYSGKCDPKGNTFAGDQVGFADIFILDIFERINGEDDGEELLIEQFLNVMPTGLIESANSPKVANNLLDQSASMLGLALKTTPASSVDYIAYVRQNLQNKKIVPEAIAANEGYGFNSFTGILPIWKGFRNIAYFFFVLIFMIMGFAIMFRVKINPQTVIGIQAILPKVIALLLIITFSYAIVGLMIDLMYVVFYLIINAFISFDIIKAGTVCDGAACMVKAASGQFGLPIAMMVQGFFAMLITPSAVLQVASGIPSVLAIIIDLLLTATGIGLIIRIILGFAIIFTFFKLFLKLVGAYITVVIQLIFAPIILIGGAFPGSKAVGNWFRNLLANMSVFPTTMVFLMLSYVFLIQPIVSGLGLLGVKDLATGTLLNPPLVFMGSPSSSYVMSVIGIGLLLMASKYVDMIKDALQVPPFKYGTAISDALQHGWYQAGNIDSPWRTSGVGDSVHRRIGARVASTTGADIDEQFARVGGGTGPSGREYTAPPLPTHRPRST